jgi:hypothetical protein
MSRTWIAVFALLASSGADAQVYRCVAANGVSYQDTPCRGRDSSQSVLRMREPSVIKSTNERDTLGEWAEALGQENRKRELHAREVRLQRENEIDAAEFAAMVEQQPEQARQSQQEYRERIERRNAQLRDAQWELNQSER